MERYNTKEWINSLKIAIINNDLKKLEEYSNIKIPNFSSIDEAKEALSLIENAKNMLEKEQNKIKNKMNQLKQTQKYKNEFYNSHMNEWTV